VRVDLSPPAIPRAATGFEDREGHRAPFTSVASFYRSIVSIEISRCGRAEGLRDVCVRRGEERIDRKATGGDNDARPVAIGGLSFR
jgi:hypothetical protein